MWLGAETPWPPNLAHVLVGKCEGGFSFSTKLSPQPAPSRWVTSWWCWCFAVWACYFYGCCCVDCRKNPYKMRASRMVAHAVGLFSWDSWSCVHHGYSWIAWGVASWVKRRFMRPDWNLPGILEDHKERRKWKDYRKSVKSCLFFVMSEYVAECGSGKSCLLYNFYIYILHV